MTTPTPLTPAQRVALGEYLSEFPEHKSFEEILDTLALDGYPWDNKDGIIVWSPFEYELGADIADYIQNLHKNIKALIDAAVKETQQCP